MINSWQARRVAALVFVVLASYSGVASACVGARPMAMGGAFVGVADDSMALYWNPAGFAGLGQWQTGATVTLNNRYSYNYDLVVAAGGPISGKWGAGAGYILSTLGAGSSVIRNDWFVASVARSIDDRLLLGASARYETESYAPMSAGGEGPITQAEAGTQLHESLRFDIGILFRISSWLTAGLLIQDLSSNTYSPVNVRPGIAIRPDSRSLITFDIYDLAGAWAKTTARVGYERYITDTFAIRAGYYGFSIGEWRGAVTLGAGLCVGGLKMDYAFLSGNLGGTHQLGVQVSF